MIKGIKRVKELIDFEKGIVPEDCKIIAGIDEAGRGPLAGPVLAAAVILPHDTEIEGVFDSKQLTPMKRDRVFWKIARVAIDIGVGMVDSEIIDKINILQATIYAMHAALRNLLVKPDCLLTDAISLPGLDDIIQISIIKGDQKCYSIAAASIVAKVIRDRFMHKLHLRYPIYNFIKNKGYGTKEHIETITRVGPCPQHRHTFKRVREFCQTEGTN